jgi:hypothetical protein
MCQADIGGDSTYPVSAFIRHYAYQVKPGRAHGRLSGHFSALGRGPEPRFTLHKIIEIRAGTPHTQLFV